MPDIRKHRGAHPEDRKLFAEARLSALRCAVGDLSWLLTRDYSIKSALKLVGDRYLLTERQRLAISRAACSDKSRQQRVKTVVSHQDTADQEVIVDGFNLIITVEAALSDGVLMLCRDGCIRDLSGVHGSYRAVTETDASITLIGEALESLKAKSIEWVLDQPVSNSGRLAKRIRDEANRRSWPWTVNVVFNPDREIVSSDKIAITSDGSILDRVTRWVNFKRNLVEKHLAESWLIDLRV
jgi:hypothetical protein